MLVLHQVHIERRSGKVQTFNITDGEEAAWLAEVATKFRCNYAWWYRRAADMPWLLRARKGLTVADIQKEGSPFNLRVSEGSISIGPLKPTAGAPASSRSKSSPISGETGPGLEKP